MSDPQTCPHGVETPPQAPVEVRCAFCLDRHPIVVARHLVFTDGDGGIVWVPLQLVTLTRVSSDDAGPKGYLDVALVAPGHPALDEAPGGPGAGWTRIDADDPHGVAVAIAAGRWT